MTMIARQGTLIRRVIVGLAGAALATPLVSAASPGPAPALSLDQAFAVYRTGDHDVVSREFKLSQDFQRLRLTDRRMLNRWLGPWEREKAAFLLELMNASSLNAPAYTMLMLPPALRYVSQRARSAGSSAGDVDEQFERLWHRIVVAILQRRLFDGPVEEYIGGLRALRSGSRPGVLDERLLLAYGVAQEQRCWREAPIKSTTAQEDCLREAALRLEDAAASAGGPARDEARVRAARVHVQLGQFPAAQRALEGVAPLEDREVAYWAWLLRGRVAAALGHHAEAERAYRAALREYPDAQSAAIGLSLAMFHQDQPVEADAIANAVRSRSTSAVDPWWSYFSADERFLDRWLVQLRKAVP